MRHVSCVLFAVLVAGAAPAQNLLDNPSFDGTLEPWSSPGGTTTTAVHRSDVGSTLAAGSGAGCIEIRVDSFSGGSNGYSQTVAAAPGQVTFLRGSYFLPSTESSAVRASFYVIWRNADRERIDEVWVDAEPAVFDQWVRLETRVVAPAHCVDAMVRIAVKTPSQPAGYEGPPSIIRYDDVELVLSDGRAEQLFIPAAASAPGSEGTYWTTTGWFTNRTDAELVLRGAFLRQDGSWMGHPSQRSAVLAVLPPQASVTLEDMVPLLGFTEQVGAVFLEASVSVPVTDAHLLSGITTTGTPDPRSPGTYGQGLPLVIGGSARQQVVAGLEHGEARRSNLGVLNTSPHDRDIVVRIFDASGAQLVETTWRMRPFQHRQESLTSIGVAALSGGSARFTDEHYDPAGSFLAYLSSVDQFNGDAIFTLAE